MGKLSFHCYIIECATMESILNSTTMSEEINLVEKQLTMVKTKIRECTNEHKHQKHMKLQQDLDKKLDELFGKNFSDSSDKSIK